MMLFSNFKVQLLGSFIQEEYIGKLFTHIQFLNLINSKWNNKPAKIELTWAQTAASSKKRK